MVSYRHVTNLMKNIIAIIIVVEDKVNRIGGGVLFRQGYRKVEKITKFYHLNLNIQGFGR